MVKTQNLPSHLVFDWYQVVTDRWTDRITVANMHYSP